MSRLKDKNTKRQKDKKTKRQKDKKTKKTKRQKSPKRLMQKDENTKGQRPKREFYIETSGQFRMLAIFFVFAFVFLVSTTFANAL